MQASSRSVVSTPEPVRDEGQYVRLDADLLVERLSDAVTPDSRRSKIGPSDDVAACRRAAIFFAW
jgi:hypothetical protein